MENQKTSDKFEKEFGDFIDGQKFENINNEFFTLLRAVFAAGWNAAEEWNAEKNNK